MNVEQYNEMKENLNSLETRENIKNKKIYIFGMSNASQELCDLLILKNIIPYGILDNNSLKQGTNYKKIPVISPLELVKFNNKENSLVLIVSRAYFEMYSQLEYLGYKGKIVKLLDFNSFSNYSMSLDTVLEKKVRLKRGIKIREKFIKKYPNFFRLICPFNALGDVYYALMYFPHFRKKLNLGSKYVVFTVGNPCKDVAKMFGVENVEVLNQKDMDEFVQSEIYFKSKLSYIAHHDRPYTSTAYKILKIKKFNLEELYKYGVYGLNKECKSILPNNLKEYENNSKIKFGKTLIISPYAKSSMNINIKYWEKIIKEYREKGFHIYTNAVGNEQALKGTEKISAPLNEMNSLVEKAGIFIGLRSGLCDIIKNAKCKKVALYPNNYYSDTKWRTDEVFYLKGWENKVIYE